MHIALCCDTDVKAKEQLLDEYGEVTVCPGDFDRPPGVELAYHLARGHPCDLAVVMLDGAAGMLCCRQIKERQKSLLVLWISEQEEFWEESRRIGVAEFLINPVPEGMLRKVVKHLLEDKQKQLKDW